MTGAGARLATGSGRCRGNSGTPTAVPGPFEDMRSLLILLSIVSSAASVAAQAPAITFATPANGAIVLDTFVAAGSSTNATLVELRVDAGPFVAANGLSPWDVVFEPGALPPGPHTLTARASAAGASVTTSIQITVGTPPAGSQTITYVSSIDAVAMQARLWLPAGFQPGAGPRPLLVYLHGGGGNGTAMLNAAGGALVAGLDARGWIGIAPDGRPWGLAALGCPWQTSAAYVNSPNPAAGPGEQDIFDAIDWAIASYPIDVDRIYLTGFSMGGRGTYGIGLRNPDRFAAIAPLGPASDMYEIYVRRPDPVACKEGMVGGPAGQSAAIDTMYTITSGRFLLENAAALPVFHGHGTLDTVANNVASSGLWLHGYHLTIDGSWSGCHGTSPFCFGHTPTLQELRARHPAAYDWAYLFAPVQHQQVAQMFTGTPVGTVGYAGTVDPLNPTQLLGALDFLARRTREAAPPFVVYKTYTDTHRRAYWLELGSAVPWTNLPSAVRASYDVPANRVTAEVVRAAELVVDTGAIGLRIATNEPLRFDLSRLAEPAFDPALHDPTGALSPTLVVRGAFTGFDWVRVVQDGGSWTGAPVQFAPGEVRIGPLAIASATQLELWPVRAFTNLGLGLAGAGGMPLHGAAGPLLVGATTTLTVTDVAPDSLVAVVVGFAAANAPFLGGTLVPQVDLVAPGVADGAGARSESFAWPPGMPANAALFSQFVGLDATGPQGIVLSNALRWTTRP